MLGYPASLHQFGLIRPPNSVFIKSGRFNPGLPGRFIPFRVADLSRIARPIYPEIRTFDYDYWLLVTFAGVNQTPRQKLVSSSYAFMASGLVPGTEVNGSISSASSGILTVINNAVDETSYGVYAVSSSSFGAGVFGFATNTTGSVNGIEGLSTSHLGCGVHGENWSSTGYGYGVYGSTASGSGTGVYGFALSSSGTGVGVQGLTYANSGTAVFGEATNTTGGTIGVHGQTLSESGTGVFGEATHTTGWTIGVHGKSNSTVGSAIYGHAAATSGSAVGVRGKTESDGSTGVWGIATSATGSSNGVWGQTSALNGYGVYFSGGLAGTGTKSCVVKTSRGPTLLYCQESPENWFEDFGEGQMSNGSCHIQLDPLFLETVTINEINPMKVFIQLRDDCKGTYVKTGTHGFEVKELQGGSSSAGFAYRVVAKRRGFEDQRLDYCKAAEEDSFLYPEISRE